MSTSLAAPPRSETSRGGAAPIRIDVVLVGVAALTAIAFVLRASQLRQSLVGDEVFTYQDISGHSFSSVLSTVHTGGENSPPLYFLLAWASAKLGDPTVFIRIPSLMLGTATVPVVYAVGRETVGRAAALIGALVFALTPFAVFYGVEARPYATMTFFVALSTLALLRAVATRSRWWWLVYVGSAVAAAYTHYTSIFVLGVQAAWSFWACRDRIRQPLVANALAALLYLPWIPHLRGKLLVVIGVLHPLRAGTVLTDLLRPIPGYPAAPLRAIPTILGLVVVGACVLAGLVAASIRARRTATGTGWARPSSNLILITALAAATPVGLLLYSLLVADLWLPRGLSASMPALALVLGALLASMPRPLTAVCTVVVAVTLIAGTLRSFGQNYNRGPYRAVAEYLDRVASPNDPITVVSLPYRPAEPAITAQFHKPHLLLQSTSLWLPQPPGEAGYLVLDDTFANALGVRVPGVTGFQFVDRRHYPGSSPTDLLTYRLQSGAGR